MEQKQNALDALSSFSRQMQKFNSSEMTERPVPLYPKPTLQQKIAASEEEHVNSVKNAYKKFLTPQDAETQEDELELLAAYRLFTASEELNKTAATKQTFIRTPDIVSPLTQKSRYGSGGEFVYLQAWFVNEGAKAPFIPEFTRGTSSLIITFVPQEEHVFTPREKEIFSIISQNFYPEQ